MFKSFFFCFSTLNEINCLKKYEYHQSHSSFNFPNLCSSFLAQLVKPVPFLLVATELRLNGHLNLKRGHSLWTKRALSWCQICSLKMPEIALPWSLILKISQGSIPLDPLEMSLAQQFFKLGISVITFIFIFGFFKHWI